MLVAIVSDTHMPRRARRLPHACAERCRAADMIVHAGDLTTTAVLEELRGYGEVLAVHGNVDDRAVRRRSPTGLCSSSRTGAWRWCTTPARAPGGSPACAAAFPRPHAVIFGHSHLPLHETDARGFQIFNPGSPTDRRRAPHHTMGVARSSPEGLEFELIALD